MRPIQRLDVDDPDRLYQHLDELHREVKRLRASTAAVEAEVAKPIALTPNMLDGIRNSLQAGGSHALDLTNLRGTGGAQQDPIVGVGAALPDATTTKYVMFARTSDTTLHYIDRSVQPYAWRQIA